MPASSMNGSVSGSQITLTWTNSDPFNLSDPSCTPSVRTSYTLEKSLDQSTWFNVGAVTASATSFTTTPGNGNWYFRLNENITDYGSVLGGSGCDPTTRTANGVSEGPWLVGTDTVPDAFTFTDKVSQPLSSTVTSDAETITGITGATPISVTNGSYSINGGAFTSAAGTVNNNDSVRLQVTSSSSFSTAAYVDVNIGGVTDQWSVTTQNMGGTVTAPSSGTISYNDVRACWGPSVATAVSMYDWRKNGPYWQDLPENQSVPTDNPFTLSDFYGIKGVWELSQSIPAIANGTAPEAGTAQVNIPVSTAGVIPLEMKWTLVTGSDTGVTYNTTYGVWNALGNWQAVLASDGTDSAVFTVRLHVRPVGSTQEVTQDINVSLTVGLG